MVCATLRDYIEDEVTRYRVATSFTTWRHGGCAREPTFEEACGWESKGEDYTAKELLDVLEGGAYVLASCCGPHRGGSASTWISSEPQQDPSSGWWRYTSLHLVSEGMGAERIWCLLLNGFDVRRYRTPRMN